MRSRLINYGFFTFTVLLGIWGVQALVNTINNETSRRYMRMSHPRTKAPAKVRAKKTPVVEGR